MRFQQQGNGGHLQAVAWIVVLYTLFAGDVRTSCGQTPDSVNERPSAMQKQWRLIFIGPQEAVTLQVTVTAENGPEAKQVQLAGMLLKRYDADSDQFLSDEEAARLPRGARVAGPSIGDEWKKLDTTPTDDRLNVEELTAFIRQEFGEPFRIRILPSRSFQSIRLVERLDQDHDTALSMAELTGSVSRLRQADLDDDEAVSIDELMPRPRRQGQPAVVDLLEAPLFLLDDPAGRGRALDRVLLVHGGAASGREVSLDRLRSGEPTREMWDRNQNRQLDREELDAWLRDAMPAVNLEAFLGDRKKSKVALREGTETQSGTTVSADLGGATVEMNAINISFEQTASAKLYRTRFLVADRDKNGYLDAGEFGTLQSSGSFADADANGDGMLLRDELMIFADYEGIAAQAHIALTVSDVSRTLFELLDANVDRRLTPREVSRGSERLQAVDRNQDQNISNSELESRYRMTLSLGRNDLFAGRMNAPMVVPNARVRTRRDGPSWHQRMDRNQDGDVSWREFLGSREQFDAIDVDDDGLIDATESAPPTSTKAAP